ncbi:hypothetical protein L873DRAFT_1808622 [Choiromyces venosus 120613-1]|uniref:Uncharacterized protein n=1 Tax=Choiromyces venosus 120613-1 TaxID=1336337 RepID=A0A3N4JJ98_9PEZI|nr:hypothetical protein L873DRAFT_1808622 [Choiromyces venosus 120613-1]
MVHCLFRHVSVRYQFTYETAEQAGEEEVRNSYAIGGEYAGASRKALMYRREILAKFSFV